MAGRALAARTLRLFSTPITLKNVDPYTNAFVRGPVSNFSTTWRGYASNGVNGTQDAIEDHSATTGETGPLPVGMNVPDESTASVFADSLPAPDGSSTNWSTSYQGLSVQPFPPEAAETLMAPIDPLDIEIKPDGLIYLPEIKYRRILNKTFGPGGWGLAPRSPTHVGPKVVSREYALVCLGRLVAVARGEQEYFDKNGVPTATEACKSNALMRCCKDLGVASELWDPRFIREFKGKNCVEAFVEHVPTKRKRKLWRRKDAKFEYPYKE